jgi:hypothetical protein
MASTLGMYSKVNPVEENTLNGTRRSRFSFHFMTHRTRRWLLVQWVSIPVTSTEGEQSARQAQLEESRKRPTYHTLLNDYTTRSWLSRPV